MKTIFFLFLFFILLIAGTGCKNKGQRKIEGANQTDTSTVADTGFTGITKFYSKKVLVEEVTFKNGVKNGIMKTFRPNGQLNQTFWYRNGLREDTAKLYFADGKVFRTTPFKNDSMNGIQTQYYGNGIVRAKLNFVNGARSPNLEEFHQDGKKITDYPEIIINTKDTYNQNGTFKISLGLNKKDVKVTFYRGEYIDGLFLPKKYTKLNTDDYKGYLELRKSSSGGNSYVGIIAEISTTLGNKYLTYKKIDLPYNDLK